MSETNLKSTRITYLSSWRLQKP